MKNRSNSKASEVLDNISNTHFHPTELGNAERLVERYEDKFKYCPTKGWLIWNGKHWENDTSREIVRCAKETVRNIYTEAGECEIYEARKTMARHALNSEKELSIRNMIKLAETELPFVILEDKLDQDPWLFNLANGTLNLKTLELQPHNPANYITKYSDVIFDPKATHETVNALIELLHQDNRAECLQRSFGSCLYGEAPNETLWYLVGEGGTGKSTLLETLAVIMGNYAATIDATLLIDNSSKNTGGPRPDLLDLMGTRLVIAKEIPKYAKLNAGDVKSLTGRDTISARALNSNQIVRFAADFKIIVHSNYDIKIPWDDSGVKRRLLRIPFYTKPSHPDPEFKTILKTNPIAKSAFLNWIFQGYIAWIKSKYNLAISPDIDKFTNRFWEEADPFHNFAEEKLDFKDEAAITPFKEIWQTYSKWCEENGVKPQSQKALGDWLTKKGCISKVCRSNTQKGTVRSRLGVKSS